MLLRAAATTTYERIFNQVPANTTVALNLDMATIRNVVTSGNQAILESSGVWIG